MANRVWQHLFGQGLVRSVDNFGVTGDAPSHPELLDHLARQFIRDGWSVKRLVRNVVLTSRQESSGKVRWTICNLIPFAKRRLSGHESGSSVLPTAERHEEP